VLGDDPIGYWRLGDALDNTVMSDATGAHPGVYANGAGGSPQLGIAGDGSTAAYFVGGNQFGYVNGVAAPTGAYSMEAWVLPVAGGAGMIMQQGGSGALYIDGGGRYVFVPQSNDSTIQVVDTAHADAVPATGAMAFHQVVGAWDGTTATLYVDGRAVASAAASRAPSGSATLYIGYGTFAPPLHGFIDEAAYYAHALDPTRVQAHFAADPPPPLWTARPMPAHAPAAPPAVVAASPPRPASVMGPVVALPLGAAAPAPAPAHPAVVQPPKPRPKPKPKPKPKGKKQTTHRPARSKKKPTRRGPTVAL
jgi:hypothetical protein